MNYKILKDGEVVNIIVADADFVEEYCKTHGYTYEEKILPEPEIVEPEPTADELMDILLGVSE